MVNRVQVSSFRWEEQTRLPPGETASLVDPCQVGERIVSTSDLDVRLPENPEKQAQVWNVKPDGSDLRAHTAHTSTDGYCRNVATDGGQVVFHVRGKLHVLDSLGAGPQEVPVNLALGKSFPITAEALDRLDSVTSDHDDDGSLVEWRGQMWFLTRRSGSAHTLSTSPGVRIREVTPLGNTGEDVWATDAEDEDRLEIASLDGQDNPPRIKHGQLGQVFALTVNPEGSEVAVASCDGAVLVASVAGNTVRKVGNSRQGEATGLVLNPSERYLVWREALGNEGALGRPIGHDSAENRPFELTCGQFNDFSPTFSLNGHYLYSLSGRTIDPTYDEISFDLGFTNIMRPYVVPLSMEGPTPSGPLADGWAISETRRPEDKKLDKDATKPEADVVLDTNDTEDRMVPLSVPADRYDRLCTTIERVLWRRLASYTGVFGSGQLSDQETKDSIETYDTAKRKLTVVVNACDDATASGDGRQLVARNNDDLWVQSVGAQVEDEDRVVVNLNRLRRQLLPRDEWRQMFDRNARLMRDHYWREDMNGTDRGAVCTSHRLLLEWIITYDDLIDVLAETNAELNASHAYATPTSGHGDAKMTWLGVDLGRNRRGEVVINRTLDGESPNPKARFPLRATDVAARAGDVIVTINRKPIAGVPDTNTLLLGAAGNTVGLTLVRGDSKRRAVVVPVTSEVGLHYHEWVTSRVRRVRECPRGWAGYVHVSNMMAKDWAGFHQLIEQASRCEVVVMNVRYNGGGHTPSLMLERLTQTVVGWGYAWHMNPPEPYPGQGMHGPMAFITNPYAESDGSIITVVAQNPRLGPMVGERS